MNSFKHLLLRGGIKRFSLAVVSIMLQCSFFHDAIAQDYGNTAAQEYGDAVYVYLNLPWYYLGSLANYNHTAIYAGLDSSGNGRVLQAYGSGFTTGEYSFYDYFTSKGSGYYGYYGAYTLNNTTLTFSQRKSVVSTAINLANGIPYPSGIPACINYAGTPPVSIFNILNIRCDGFVDYCYNYNGFRV